MKKITIWIAERITKFSPILFHSPPYRSFGACAEEIHYGILRARREGKKVLFIYPRQIIPFRTINIANKELFHLESEYIFPTHMILGTILGCLLTIFVVLLHFLDTMHHLVSKMIVSLGLSNKLSISDGSYRSPSFGQKHLWVPSNATLFDEEVFNELDWARQYLEFDSPNITPYKVEECIEETKMLGIPAGAWFVCLHVTESFEKHVRGAKIDTYYDAIQEITSRGGWVVRLGDPSMPSLKDLPQVIDYAHYSKRRNLLDLYLIQQCEFLIGVCSGPNQVAHLFRKRVIATNMTNWTISFPQKYGDEAIIKHIYSTALDRKLNITELLTQPFHWQAFENHVHPDYYHKDNESHEIAGIVADQFDQDETYSSKQSKFNFERRKKVISWLKEGQPIGWKGVPNNRHLTQQYRIAAMSEIAGSLGKTFIEENWS